MCYLVELEQSTFRLLIYVPTHKIIDLSVAPEIKCSLSGNQAQQVTWSLCSEYVWRSSAFCKGYFSSHSYAKILFSIAYMRIPEPQSRVCTTDKEFSIVRWPCAVRSAFGMAGYYLNLLKCLKENSQDRVSALESFIDTTIMSQIMHVLSRDRDAKYCPLFENAMCHTSSSWPSRIFIVVEGNCVLLLLEFRAKAKVWRPFCFLLVTNMVSKQGVFSIAAIMV